MTASECGNYIGCVPETYDPVLMITGFGILLLIALIMIFVFD